MSKTGTWVISVATYGSFFFEGNEESAEDMRIHKSRWEGGIGRKRLADPKEIETGKIDSCLNHPNFKTKSKYYCTCQKCNHHVRTNKK